jgi:hypothetical protein
MKNVYDLEEYKKRKKRLKITRTFNKYKVLISTVALFSISMMLWSFVSLKVAVIFSAIILLLPLIFNKKSYLTPTEKLPLTKPQ